MNGLTHACQRASAAECLSVCCILLCACSSLPSRKRHLLLKHTHLLCFINTSMTPQFVLAARKRRKNKCSWFDLNTVAVCACADDLPAGRLAKAPGGRHSIPSAALQVRVGSLHSVDRSGCGSRLDMSRCWPRPVHDTSSGCLACKTTLCKITLR